MKAFAVVLIFASWLFTPTLWGQQATPATPVPAVSPAGVTTHTVAPTQAEIAACQAALPPAPVAPKPHDNSMYQGAHDRFKKWAANKAGIDIDAMQQHSDKAAADKYQADKQEYDKKRNACSAPVIAPAVAALTPSVAPAEAKPVAPAPVASKPVQSADGRHLFVCPKNATNAPDGLLACVTADGSYVPLQEVPIPAGALPPPAAPQPAAKKMK